MILSRMVANFRTHIVVLRPGFSGRRLRKSPASAGPHSPQRGRQRLKNGGYHRDLDPDRKPAVLAFAALAAASLTAGCFEPLYGARPSPGTDSVRDKLASITIAPMAGKAQ